MNATRHLYAIGGILTLLTAASFGTGGLKPAPAASSSNVTVNNTTSNPVPVALAASAKVGINGTVALSPNTTVGLTKGGNGDPIYVRDQDGAKTPIEASAVLTITPNTDGKAGVTIFTVPADKILVIQTIYGYAFSPFAEPITSAQVSSYDGFTEHDFPVHFLATAAANVANSDFMTSTNLYVEPGAFINLSAQRNGMLGTSTVTVGFSGYLMDAPQ